MRALLLSLAAYTLPDSRLPTLDSPQVEEARSRVGGQLTLQPPTRTRWYLADLETAEYEADAGNLQIAGQLMRSVDRDGVIQGTMSTRGGGLVSLPKIWDGPQDIVDGLQAGGVQARSVFDEMCPGAELEALDVDGIKLGIGVAELVPVEGREYPVLVRRLPENLIYRWSENRWYFRTAVSPGMIPITPGDGRWVLHIPGGREAPWQRGIWRALGRAYITKDHARLHRDNWEAKLANPARVATSPQGAGEEHKQSWFRKVMAWGVNSVFGVGPGYDVKLLESNGRGADSFVKTIAEQDTEIHNLVRGQTVTSDGGVGFANAEVFRKIEADLIQKDGNGLAHTINTQVIPAYVLNVWGEDRLGDCPTMGWDTTPPIDQKALADSLGASADAMTKLQQAAAAVGLPPFDMKALARRFRVPFSPEVAKPATSGNVVPIRDRKPAPDARAA